MTSSLDDLLPPLVSDLTISPSALGQFIRFDQCHRLFRFDLYPDDAKERLFNATRSRPDYGPTLLSAAGKDWEVEFRDWLKHAGWNVLNPDSRQRSMIQHRVERTPASERRVLQQPSLSGVLEGWQVDDSRPDLVFVERTDCGALKLMVADLKSSRDVRLEHRLQVAMYSMLLACLFPEAEITEAVIYRTPVDPPDLWSDEQRQHRADALELLSLPDGAMLALADRPERYHAEIRRSILARDSVGREIAGASFSTLPFHVSAKCDGCAYSQVCLASCRATEDLSLIPYLAERTKRELRSEGVETVAALATVRERNPDTFAELMASPSVGPELLELIQRTRAYLAWRDEHPSMSTWLEHRGQSDLPSATATRHPNLIKIYLDLQIDASEGRVYLAGALVSCLVDGIERPDRQRVIVEMAEGPPDSQLAEATLLRRWLQQVLQAINELSAPDLAGDRRAPIHFYLWDDAQRSILEALVNRQHDAVFGIQAVMELMMQMAAFDSNNLSVVATEVKKQRALPMLCQPLHAVAPWFGFAWPEGIRDTFKFRVFDSLARVDDAEHAQLVPVRARFRSEIPTEYAYLAWDQQRKFRSLEHVDPEQYRSTWGYYGDPTSADILAFQQARLEALRQIVHGLNANNRAEKSSFDLSVLNWLKVRPDLLIEAVREFISIERHHDLGEWRRIRSMAQDRRVQLGETLVVEYRDADQTVDVRARIFVAREAFQRRAAKYAADPEAEREKADNWSLEAAEISVRVSEAELPETLRLETVLLNTRIKEKAFVIFAPARHTFTPDDSDEELSYQTTARQLLSGFRGVVKTIDGEGWLTIKLRQSWRTKPGFIVSTWTHPPEDGETWVVDVSPDSDSASRQWDVTTEVQAGRFHTAYEWLAGTIHAQASWTEQEAEAQRAFLDGLTLLRTIDDRVPEFETSKQQYIGCGGGDRMTLVQGPPGTGKSTTTGYALWSRMQGALASGRDFRVAVACKTHSATNTLLRAIRDARDEVLQISLNQSPDVDALIDRAIHSVGIYRYDPNELGAPSGTTQFAGEAKDKLLRLIRDSPVVVVGGTTNGICKLAEKSWKDGDPPWDLVIVDEASQMSLPEFLAASVGLKPDGRMIVVGDHRQMPPIIKAKWEEGDSVAVDPYAAYRSVFDVIRADPRPKTQIRFTESFRIHRDIAEYLRREVYVKDQIDFKSRQEKRFTGSSDLEFVEGVLGSPAPLVLITHDERDSQQRNPLEGAIAEDIILAIKASDPNCRVGVVVPHRAQRAALRARLLERTGDNVLADSVDTIERFQGDQRDVIIYSATESDPAYLRDTGTFLFDPRRLTVAISRATHKLSVIAAESLFNYLAQDEEALDNSAIWRGLREYACTDIAWEGQVEGHNVTVSRSVPLSPGGEGPLDQGTRR